MKYYQIFASPESPIFLYLAHINHQEKFLFLSVQYPDQNVQHHEADTAAAGTKRQKRSPTRARDVPVRRLISFFNFLLFGCLPLYQLAYILGRVQRVDFFLVKFLRELYQNKKTNYSLVVSLFCVSFIFFLYKVPTGTLIRSH